MPSVRFCFQGPLVVAGMTVLCQTQKLYISIPITHTHSKTGEATEGQSFSAELQCTCWPSTVKITQGTQVQIGKLKGMFTQKKIIFDSGGEMSL